MERPPLFLLLPLFGTHLCSFVTQPPHPLADSGSLIALIFSDRLLAALALSFSAVNAQSNVYCGAGLPQNIPLPGYTIVRVFSI